MADKNKFYSKNNYLTNKTGIIISLIIGFISFIFIFISFLNTIQINKNISSIHYDSYNTYSACLNAEIYISQMNVNINQLEKDKENLNEIINSLDKLYKKTKYQIDIIQKNYIKDEKYKVDNEIKELETTYKYLFQNINNYSQDEIKYYVNESINPIYNKIINYLHKITIINPFINNKAIIQTHKITTTNNILLICIFILIIIAILIFNIAVIEKNTELYYHEMFSELSSNIDEVILIFDTKNRKIEYVSENSKKILGIDNNKFYNNALELAQYMDKDDSKEFLKLFNENIVDSKIKRECYIKNPDTNLNTWLNINIFPIKYLKTVKRYIIIISDLTKTKNTQEAIKDALINAENANSAKKEFLSRMSHEIRTPLNAIIGMSTIAGSSIDDKSKIENCISNIDISSKHLLCLVNDILDMSKIDSGKLNIAHEIFNISEFMKSITSIIYPQAVEKEQIFDVTIVGLTEEILIGDALRLNQILINLLSNSIKFTPIGGKIKLELKQVSKDNKYVQINFTVKDNGIGMSEEFLQEIYTPFKQENRINSQSYGGTGLGMGITKNLVTLMNGSISVSSTLNKGTKFIVSLSFEYENNNIEQVYEHEKYDNLKVLIVDDDNDACKQAKMIFDKLGAQTDYVLSGREAVNKVIDANKKDSDYNICLIDWQMPEIDGIETTRLIRNETGDDTLIIIISSYDFSEIENEAKQAGANNFIQKPIFSSTVCDLLDSLKADNEINKSKNIISEKRYNFTGKNIIVAEDNFINMEIALEFLKETNANIECAVNGLEVYEMFKKSPLNYYDMILMDIQMPVMNGYISTQHIRKLEREDALSIPILAMTANAFNEDISAALSYGMDGHIAKPIDKEKLLEYINKYMEMRLKV